MSWLDLVCIESFERERERYVKKKTAKFITPSQVFLLKLKRNKMIFNIFLSTSEYLHCGTGLGAMICWEAKSNGFYFRA